MTGRRKSTTPEAEVAAPEADQLEGFPHPRFTANLFGHAAAETEMLDAVKSGRLHHAWLITGPEGVGKATLAWRVARFLLAGVDPKTAQSLAVSLDCAAVKPVLALSHPGLLLLRRMWNEKTKKHGQSIAVDEVRRLREFVGHTSAGGWRVVIIDRAEEMQAAAANAVLKTLEEPPRRTVFLLVASEPGRLLPTIQSRCRRLDLAPLGPADLRQAMAVPLAVAGIAARAPEDAALHAGLANGSVRRALVLASGGGMELYERLVKLLARAPEVDSEALYRLADEIAPFQHEPRFLLATSLLRDLLGRLVLHVTRGRGALPGEPALFERLAPRPDAAAAARWAAFWLSFEKERMAVLELNLDRKSFLVTHMLAAAAMAGT